MKENVRDYHSKPGTPHLRTATPHHTFPQEISGWRKYAGKIKMLALSLKGLQGAGSGRRRTRHHKRPKGFDDTEVAKFRLQEKEFHHSQQVPLSPNGRTAGICPGNALKEEDTAANLVILSNDSSAVAFQRPPLGQVKSLSRKMSPNPLCRENKSDSVQAVTMVAVQVITQMKCSCRHCCCLSGNFELNMIFVPVCI